MSPKTTKVLKWLGGAVVIVVALRSLDSFFGSGYLGPKISSQSPCELAAEKMKIAQSLKPSEYQFNQASAKLLHQDGTDYCQIVGPYMKSLLEALQAMEKCKPGQGANMIAQTESQISQMQTLGCDF